jgi:hypothetical protein
MVASQLVLSSIELQHSLKLFVCIDSTDTISKEYFCFSHHCLLAGQCHGNLSVLMSGEYFILMKCASEAELW